MSSLRDKVGQTSGFVLSPATNRGKPRQEARVASVANSPRNNKLIHSSHSPNHPSPVVLYGSSHDHRDLRERSDLVAMNRVISSDPLSAPHLMINRLSPSRSGMSFPPLRHCLRLRLQHKYLG